MYIDGNLKGGFQTVKAYAEFCAKFKSWMEEKSLKVWPPRIGGILAQDYRDSLDYVNKSVRIYILCFFILTPSINTSINEIGFVCICHRKFLIQVINMIF